MAILRPWQRDHMSFFQYMLNIFKGTEHHSLQQSFSSCWYYEAILQNNCSNFTSDMNIYIYIFILIYLFIFSGISKIDKTIKTLHEMKMKFTTYVIYASWYQIQNWPSGSRDACWFKVPELENERYNNTTFWNPLKLIGYWEKT